MKKPVEIDEVLYCPICMIDNMYMELEGDGENHLECERCDYVIHEADLF